MSKKFSFSTAPQDLPTVIKQTSTNPLAFEKPFEVNTRNSSKQPPNASNNKQEQPQSFHVTTVDKKQKLDFTTENKAIAQVKENIQTKLPIITITEQVIDKDDIRLKDLQGNNSSPQEASVSCFSTTDADNYVRTVINEAKSRIVDDNSLKTMKIVQFNYLDKRVEFLRKAISGIQQQNTYQMRKSNIQEKIIQPIDMLNYYVSNQAELQQQPQSIETQQLIDFYMYVYGDRQQKLIQTTKMPQDYTFLLPNNILQNANSQKLISSDFDSEVAYLKQFPDKLTQILPHIYRLEIKCLEILNKYTEQNLDGASKELVLLISQYLVTNPISNYPKLIMFVFIDQIILKAGMEIKFQRQYLKLIIKVFQNKAIIDNVLNNEFDLRIFNQKMSDTKKNDSEIMRQQYVLNMWKKLAINIISEQVQFQQPRSVLLQIDQQQSEEQQKYKKELQVIYFSQLANFIGILYIEKHINHEKFFKYAEALIKFNYNKQVQKEMMVSKFDLYAHTKVSMNDDANIDYNIAKFDESIFKQQISLLNCVVPELLFVNDVEILEQYKNENLTNQVNHKQFKYKQYDEKTNNFINQIFGDEIHCKLLKLSDDIINKLNQNQSVTSIDIIKNQKVYDYYQAGQTLVKLFVQYIKPFTCILQGKMKFEIEELDFHIITKFSKSKKKIQKRDTFQQFKNQLRLTEPSQQQAPQVQQVESFSQKLEEIRKAKTQNLKLFNTTLTTFWQMFLESDVEGALLEVFNYDSSSKMIKQSHIQTLFNILFSFILEHPKIKDKILNQFIIQLIKLTKKLCNEQNFFKDKILCINFPDLVDSINFDIIIITLIKNSILSLLEVLQYLQQIDCQQKCVIFINSIIIQLVFQCKQQIQVQNILQFEFKKESEEDEEDEVDYVENFNLFINQQEIQIFVQLLLQINQQQENILNIYKLTQVLQIIPIFVDYLKLTVTQANLIDFAFNNQQLIQENQNILKFTLKLILSSESAEQFICSNKSTIQSLKLQTIVQICVQIYLDSCNDFSAFKQATQLLIQYQLLNKQEAVEYITSQNIGPFKTLKQDALFTEWSVL